MALHHCLSHHLPLHSHSLCLQSGLFYSYCCHHQALAQSQTPGTRGTTTSSMHRGSWGFVAEHISSIYRWHSDPLTCGSGQKQSWDFGHRWVMKVHIPFLPFPTLLPLALFRPKVSQSHPTCIIIAAHTGKTLDPCLHIWLSAVINKDNVAAGHRAQAPIVRWVPNSPYGSPTLVGAGLCDHLWCHIQPNSTLFLVWCTWATAIARLLLVSSLLWLHLPLEKKSHSILHVWSWASQRQYLLCST